MRRTPKTTHGGRRAGAGAAPRADAAAKPIQIRVSPGERERAEAIRRDGETLSEVARLGLDVLAEVRRHAGDEPALVWVTRAAAALAKRR